MSGLILYSCHWISWITSPISTWFSSATLHSKHKLWENHWLSVPTFRDLYLYRVCKRTGKIMANPLYPSHSPVPEFPFRVEIKNFRFKALYQQIFLTADTRTNIYITTFSSIIRNCNSLTLILTLVSCQCQKIKNKKKSMTWWLHITHCHVCTICTWNSHTSHW